MIAESHDAGVGVDDAGTLSVSNVVNLVRDGRRILRLAGAGLVADVRYRDALAELQLRAAEAVGPNPEVCHDAN